MKKRILLTAAPGASTSLLSQLAAAMRPMGFDLASTSAPAHAPGCPKLKGRRLVNTLKSCPPKRYRGAA